MRVVSHKTILEASRKHPNAAASLDSWYRTALRATWQNVTDVRQDYPHADLVGRRTVFNINGNHLRMITRINYQQQIIYVGEILTHAEYNKENWK